MTDIFAIGVGTLECLTDNLCAQFGGRNILEAATKGSNGSAHTADNNNFTTHFGLLKFKSN